VGSVIEIAYKGFDILLERETTAKSRIQFVITATNNTTFSFIKFPFKNLQ
jgi:hypothetical protein